MKDFNRASITWTVKQMQDLFKKGRLTFDNAVQRGLVWDDAKKSLLIDSILQGYEIPPMYAKKGEGSVYDMLDGKQRCNAILSFIANEFSLTGLSEELESYDALTFDQLDTDDQDIIMSYPLKITYFDGITDAEVQEIFYRLNNGKPLSTYEQTRVKAKSLPIVQKFTKSPLFDTGRKYPGYKCEELVYKLMMVLNDPEPDLERKSLTEYIRNHTITPEEEKQANEAFNLYYNMLEDLKAAATGEAEKSNLRIYKRLTSPTHMLSVMPFMLKGAKDGHNARELRYWLAVFYNGKKRATISDEYNLNASRGSAKRLSVSARKAALEKNYEDWFKEEGEDEA